MNEGIGANGGGSDPRLPVSIRYTMKRAFIYAAAAFAFAATAVAFAQGATWPGILAALAGVIAVGAALSGRDVR